MDGHTKTTNTDWNTSQFKAVQLLLLSNYPCTSPLYVIGMSVLQVHICRQAIAADVRCKAAHVHTHSLTTTLLAQSIVVLLFSHLSV